MAVSSRASPSGDRIISREGYVTCVLAERLRRWHSILGLVSEAATEAPARSKAKFFGRDLPHVPHIHCRCQQNLEIREAAIVFVSKCQVVSLILLGSCLGQRSIPSTRVAHTPHGSLLRRRVYNDIIGYTSIFACGGAARLPPSIFSDV